MRLGYLSDATFSQRPGGASRSTDRWIASFPKQSDVELVFCPHGAVDRDCSHKVVY